MIYRVYIFVPFQSNKYGPYATVCGSLPNGCYNTGRLDDTATVMRCTDAKQFASLQDMLVYAQSNNEIPMEAQSIEEVNALCSAPQTTQPPVITATAPAVSQPAQPVGIPIPQPTPGLPGPGSPPAVVNVTDTQAEPTEFTKGEDMAIYRLILESGPNRFDTGATYPGCSRATPTACKPVQFASMDDAIRFARDHGEIPVKVNSEAEAWDIVEGRKPVDEANVLAGGGNLLLVGAAIAAAFILPKFLKGGKKS
jgi:hypothetical protein